MTGDVNLEMFIKLLIEKIHLKKKVKILGVKLFEYKVQLDNIS